VAVDPSEREAWIALASTPGVGDETFAVLLAEFGCARDTLAAVVRGDLDRWMSARRRLDGRPPMAAPAMAELRSTAIDPSARLAAIAADGLWTVTPLDVDFPVRLRDLDPPPLMVLGLGDPATLRASRSVAVVGTRRPTVAGRALAARIAARLVEAGAVVVSGLALGIDGAAHAVTVEHDGRTVAVLGAGHRSPGPRAHRLLRGGIIDAGGAIVSEHHPDTRARKGTYPRRNRIIAALGDATIVVEAPARSGARITARLALELGRLVLIAPGRPGDWATAGSLALLRETPARPLVGLDEMIEDLGYLAPTPPALEGVAQPVLEAVIGGLGPAEQAVARRLRAGPASLDALVADTGLSAGVVSSAVTLLQLRGWAHSVGPAYLAAGALAR